MSCLKIAALFAGQGAQVVGMGKDLAGEYPEIRDLYQRADAILGFPLSTLCFEGPETELTKTSVCQPALYVHGYALFTLAKRLPGFQISGAAGLSLGEYTAHAAAGTFSFEDGLKLVHDRGRLMQEACDKTEGGMLSLIGADAATATVIAKEADLDVANFNCPGQIVLSGARSNVPKALEISKAHGIKRAIPLKVAGAYHSRLMISAQNGLRPSLDKTPMIVPPVLVVANVDGKPVTSPEQARDTMATQVCGSVRWEDCIKTLVESGVTRFIEFGPGGVLAGLLKRIDPALSCISIGSLADWKEKSNVII